MKTTNVIASVMLAFATAFLSAFFYLGSLEQHEALLQQGVLRVLCWRIYGFGILGLIAAAIWWLINVFLIKSKLIHGIELRKTALQLAAGPLLGAIVGSLAFCFF